MIPFLMHGLGVFRTRSRYSYKGMDLFGVPQTLGTRSRAHSYLFLFQCIALAAGEWLGHDMRFLTGYTRHAVPRSYTFQVPAASTS